MPQQTPYRPEEIQWDQPSAAGSPSQAGAPPPAMLDPLLGQPVSPVDLNAPVSTNPKGPAAPWLGAAVTEGTRFGAELGGELIGGKLIRPAREVGRLARLGVRAFGAGAGGAAGTVAHSAGMTMAGAPPPTLTELGQRAGATFLGGVAGEAGASTISAGVNAVKGSRLGRPFADRVGEIGRRTATTLGGHVTPAQVADSRFLHTIENVIKGSLFGGGRYRKFLAEQERLLGEEKDRILAEFGPRASTGEATTAVRSGLEREADLAAQGVEAAGARRAAATNRQSDALLGVSEQSSREAAGHRRGLLGVIGRHRTPEQAGQTWQALQEAAHRAARTSASRMYKDVDELADGVTVSLSPLIDAVAAEEKRRGQLGMALAPGRVQGTSGAVRRAGEVDAPELVTGQAADTARDALAGMPPGPERQAFLQTLQEGNVVAKETGELPDLTFEQAHEVRSAIGRQIRAAERSSDPQARNSLGFLKKLYATLDDTMTKAAGGEDTPLRQAYDTAGKAWREMADTFERGLLSDVAEKEPRLVVDTLIKPKRVQAILDAKTALKDQPGAWEAVQSSHMESILRDDKTGGWADAETLRSRLVDLTPETIEAVYGKSGARRLTDYVKMQLSSDRLTELGLATAKAGEKLAATTAKEAEAIRRKIPDAFTTLAQSIHRKDSAYIEKLRMFVGEDDWKAVQSSYAQELLHGTGEALVPGKRLMERLHKATPETLRAIFPNDKAEGLFQFARILEQLEKKPAGSGALTVSVPFMQAGALVSILTGALPRRAAAVLLLPAVMSKVVLSPTGRKWLTTGLVATKNADPSLANRAFSQLAAWAVKEGLMDPAESGRPGPPTATVPSPTQTGRGGGPGPRAGTPPPAPLSPGP